MFFYLLIISATICIYFQPSNALLGIIPLTLTTLLSILELISAYNGSSLDHHLIGSWKTFYFEKKGVIAEFQQEFECCGLRNTTDLALPDYNMNGCLDTYGVRK